MSEATIATADTATEKFTVAVDGAPNVRFRGELIASASGRWHNGRERNRFDKLKLYRTVGGKFVATKEYVSFWQGEDGHTDACVCDTATEVIEFLGHGPLAKEIYDEADIDADREIP